MTPWTPFAVTLRAQHEDNAAQTGEAREEPRPGADDLGSEERRNTDALDGEADIDDGVDPGMQGVAGEPLGRRVVSDGDHGRGRTGVTVVCDSAGSRDPKSPPASQLILSTTYGAVAIVTPAASHVRALIPATVPMPRRGTSLAAPCCQPP